MLIEGFPDSYHHHSSHNELPWQHFLVELGRRSPGISIKPISKAGYPVSQINLEQTTLKLHMSCQPFHFRSLKGFHDGKHLLLYYRFLNIIIAHNLLYL